MLQVTLGRLHQMRSVILERKAEEHRTMLMVEEQVIQAICTSIFAAAGNKKGAKAAAKFQLFKRPRKVTMPSFERVTAMFGGGDE